MADKKKIEEVSPVKESKQDSEVITINLQPLLTPISILLSSIIISSGLFFGLNNIAGNVKGVSTTAAATTPAATPPAVAGATTVNIDQIKALFSDSGTMKFGDSNRKALFVEVSDPSCPYCHIAGGKDAALNASSGSQFKLVSDGGTYVSPVEEMRKLVDAGQASFVWIYSNGHGNGEMGTRALYCAYEKGKFWEVHDLLMSAAGYDLLNNTIKNDKTQSQKLADFLAPAMSASDMKSCLDSGKYDSKITSDVALSTSLGVSGTPGFFINTTNFAGAYSWTDMKSAADKALQ
jgi:protein-disulfide isomerase